MPEMQERKSMESRKTQKEQQHQFKKYRRKFITELNYDKDFKKKTIHIFYERNSGRAVGRIMKINK